METAIPWKMGTRKRARKPQETVAREGTAQEKQSKHASWNLTSPQGSSWNRTLQIRHEDHIAEKGFDSINHCNLVHKFITILQAMKIPDAKAAVDKEWENLEKMPAWQQDKVDVKEDVVLEAQKESLLCYIVGHLSSPERGVRTKAKQIQRTSRVNASNVPGNPQLDSESVLRGTRKLTPNRDQNPANVFSREGRRQSASRRLLETRAR